LSSRDRHSRFKAFVIPAVLQAAPAAGAILHEEEEP
jgi:hypothetical protein